MAILLAKAAHAGSNEEVQRHGVAAAASTGQLETVQQLIDTLQIKHGTAATKGAQSAGLLAAASSGQRRVLQWLCDHSEYSSTELGLALVEGLKLGHSALVAVLLAAGAPLEVSDSEGLLSPRPHALSLTPCLSISRALSLALCVSRSVSHALTLCLSVSHALSLPLCLSRSPPVRVSQCCLLLSRLTALWNFS